MTSIKFRGEEVRTPFMRAVCATAAMFGVLVILHIVMIVSLPIHFALRLFGRKGFVSRDEKGVITYAASVGGFAKAESR